MPDIGRPAAMHSLPLRCLLRTEAPDPAIGGSGGFIPCKAAVSTDSADWR